MAIPLQNLERRTVDPQSATIAGLARTRDHRDAVSLDFVASNSTSGNASLRSIPVEGSNSHELSGDTGEISIDENTHSTALNEQSLPPTDEGRKAWLALVACCLVQIPVWGFCLAFGVFQEYYTAEPGRVKGSTANVALIGTTSTGILYLLSPLTFTVLTRYPRLLPYTAPFGLFLTVTGYLASSFTTQVWHLIATQGVLCAIGNGLLYSPTTLILDGWFVRRKGLAYGAIGATKSTSGVVLPFVMNASLERFGPQTTMRAWSVAMLLMTLPLILTLKPRIPISASTHSRRLDLTFLRLPSFWMLEAGNILQSLGYFLPSAYLSSYSTRLGLSQTTGTLMVSLLNGTSVPGSLIIGILADHVKVTNVIFISSIGSAISILLFWGLSTSHTATEAAALLSCFAIFYGFFAGGFSSTWSAILLDLKAASPSMETGLVYGLLAGGRGLGNVISGPLSSALIASRIGSGHGMKTFGYETEYGYLILFTGVTAILGSWAWMWKAMRGLFSHL